MSKYKARPQTIDLVQLAERLITDIRESDDEVAREIAILYLHQAFKLGDQTEWWKEQERNKMEERRDEDPEPFDYEFFGGDYE